MLAPASFPFPSLRTDVFLDNLHGGTSRGEQTEASAPEHLLPELFPYLRKLLFEEPAAGGFVGVDKFTDLCFRMRLEKNMNMVYVVIPFLQGDLIFGRYIAKDFFRPVGKCVVEDLSSVFDHQYQMIVQQKD
jgi:hypothetical protein